VQEWCTTAFERLETHGFIVRRAILPTPIKDADPFESQGAYGRLVRLGFVALLLIIDLDPEGMPCGFRRPLHERLAQERRTLEAPGHPGLFATAFRDRRNARIFLEFLGGGEAFPLFAEGDEEAGSKHGSGPWQGVKQREIGMVLARCAIAVSKSAMACNVTRSWATRACTRRTLGVMTPSSVVSAMALLRAWRRV
jgi:hypothetical protein